MDNQLNISAPLTEWDRQDVQSGIFGQFLEVYEPVLIHVDRYLDEIIIKTDYIYREVYMPWKKALHELLEGVYLMARNIPLPSKDEFMDALFMFSFHSTIVFLRDICTICQLKLNQKWEDEFQHNINQLLISISGPDTKTF